MKKFFNWWPLIAWFVFVIVLNLVAGFIPYKLYEFLFLFWIGISIVGFIPVGASLLTDVEDAWKRKEVMEPYVDTRRKRVFDWKKMRMVEVGGDGEE